MAATTGVVFCLSVASLLAGRPTLGQNGYSALIWLLPAGLALLPTWPATLAALGVYLLFEFGSRMLNRYPAFGGSQ